MADVLIPAQFFLTISATVIPIIVLIKFKMGIIIDMGAVLIFCNMILFFVLIIGYSSRLVEKSEDMITERRKIVATAYEEKVLEACVPFKFKIGQFGCLDKTTVLAVFEIIRDYIIEGLLIDFGENIFLKRV